MNVACDVHLLNITISKSGLGPEVNNVYVGQQIQECTFNVNHSTDTTLSILVNTCGTKQWTRGNYLFYNNVVYGKAERGLASPVVYSEDVTFNATCVFNRIVNVTAGFLPNSNFTLGVTGNKSANLQGYRLPLRCLTPKQFGRSHLEVVRNFVIPFYLRMLGIE